MIETLLEYLKNEPSFLKIAVAFLFSEAKHDIELSALTEKLKTGKLDLVLEYLGFGKEERPDAISSFPETRKDILSAILIENPYMGSSLAVEALREWIMATKDTASDFFCTNKDTEMFPYPAIAICQRSGAGKTKLMLEMGRKYFPLVYVNLRGEFASAPQVVSFLRSFGFDPKDPRENQANLAKHFLNAVAKYVWDLWSSKKHRQAEDFRMVLLKTFGPQCGNHSEQGEIWSQIIEQAKESSAEATLKENYAMKIADCDELGNRFVIAIDEATGLLGPENAKTEEFDAYRILRQSATQLAVQDVRPLTLLLADTNSRITNFAPNSKLDPSLRLCDEIGQLYPPFYTISGYDIFAVDYIKKMKECINGGGRWNDFLRERDQNPLLLVQLGSALWRTFIMSGGGLPSLITYARLKLTLTSSDYGMTAYIASLACRTCLNVLPSSALATDLVASNMAQLDVLTGERDRVFLSYPPDPVLAQGGALVQRAKAIEILTCLEQQMNTANVNVGDVGEAVCQFLLLSAADFAAAVEPEGKFRSYSVQHFLSHLFNPVVLGLLSESLSSHAVFAEGRMFFNHFARLPSKMTLENLGFLFGRGCAACGFSQQKGFDFAIPVLLADGSLSGIFVQVKNYEDLLKPSDVACIGDLMASGINEVFCSGREGKRKQGGMPAVMIPPVLRILINLHQGQKVSNNPVEVIDRDFVLIQGFSETVFKPAWISPEQYAAMAPAMFAILRRLLHRKDKIQEHVLAALPSKISSIVKEDDHFHSVKPFFG